jgi:hypothetical protein
MTPSEVTTLYTDLLEEAKTSTGTWSLATHNRVLEALPTMRPSQFEAFFVHIIQSMSAAASVSS